jgi:hypothetical protein
MQEAYITLTVRYIAIVHCCALNIIRKLTVTDKYRVFLKYLQYWETDNQEELDAFEFCIEKNHCYFMTLL